MKCSGDVRNPPAAVKHPSTTPSKRNLSPIPRQSDRHRQSSKKQRLISETESQTLTLRAIHTQTSTSRLEFTPHTHTQWRTLTYAHAHEKNRRRRERRSASTEGDRKWTHSPRDFSNLRDRVVIVSYNILGVENASNHPDLYCNVSQKYIDWDCRKKLIYKELNRYNPSILCFQEVDHVNDLDNCLQKDGYKGIYLGRTGEACDGCAIFWKSELFILLHQEEIEFQSFGLRDNVAQLCVFEMAESRSNTDANNQTPEPLSSRRLLVGNIHVLFNPNRGDIKLGQIRLFLEKAHKLSQEWGSIPVVIAGDLNSMPRSPLYQFLASSELDIQLHDRRKISGQMCPLEYSRYQSQTRNDARLLLHRWSNQELRLATGLEGVTHLRHHLKLYSAYAGVPGSFRTRDGDGEPLATSYHSKFMGTLDYIWHTDELVPVRVLETLPIDILRKTGGLPCKKWGSDHLALVCELAFANNGNES